MDRARIIFLASQYFREWNKVRGQTYSESAKKYGAKELRRIEIRISQAYESLLNELGPLKRAIAIPLHATKFILVIKRNGHSYLYDSIR